MPTNGTTDEQSSRAEPLNESLGEEIGQLAATVAVSHAADIDDDEDGQSRLRSVPTALWPDVPGVFFPEPYVIDFDWQRGVPEAAVRARNTAGEAYRDRAETPSKTGTPPIPIEDIGDIDDEQTIVDLEAEDIETVEELLVEDAEFDDEDLEETIPELMLEADIEEIVDSGELVAVSGPDSIQPLDDEDLEEIIYEDIDDEEPTEIDIVAAEPAAQPKPSPPPSPAQTPTSPPGVSAEMSAPPVPRDASEIPATTQELTKPMRPVRLAEGGEATPEARVRSPERIRPLRRVQGPRATQPQPNLIAAALGAGTEDVGVTGGESGRPWYEVIFDDSYFLSLPKNLHRQTRKEARFAQRWLRLEDGADILDVACGFGRHAIELAKRGFRLTGIDLSPKLIDKARAEAERRNMSIEFKVADMRELSYEARFDGVTMLGYSFGFFDDHTNAEVLRRIRRALKVKGRFLIQLLNRDRLILELPEVIWWRGQDCLILEEIELDPETSRMASKRNIVFDDGRPPWEQFIEIRLYSLHEIYTLFEEAGFRVIDISGSLHYPGLFFPTQSRELYILAERERDFI